MSIVGLMARARARGAKVRTRVRARAKARFNFRHPTGQDKGRPTASLDYPHMRTLSKELPWIKNSSKIEAVEFL